VAVVALLLLLLLLLFTEFPVMVPLRLNSKRALARRNSEGRDIDDGGRVGLLVLVVEEKNGETGGAA
jgi:hypothetical protein